MFNTYTTETACSHLFRSLWLVTGFNLTLIKMKYGPIKQDVICLWACSRLRLSKVLCPTRHISRSFQRRWGDYSISQDYRRSQPRSVCAAVWCWVVCVRPLLITVVCMCIIWKALCSYVLDACLGLWVSLEYAFTCAFTSTTNQAERRSGAAHLLARQGHERTTAWWSGPVHKEAVQLLSIQPASITSSGAFTPECNGLSGCHSLERTLYACPRI